MLPMSWDEGNAINRAAAITAWAREAADQGAAAFSAAEIARNWHYTVEIEGHPALYGIVIACGQQLAGERLAPLTAARLGPMLLFGIAAAAMFYRLVRQYSFVAALGGVAALLTMPRLFAHAHFASFDGPLTSCWILAWALFAPAMASQQRRATTDTSRVRSCFGWPLAWGAALGAAMSCKLTGWLAALPFAAFVLVYGNRKTAAKFAVGLVVALATFWLLNPRLWHDPLDGMRSFLALNLNRAGTAFDIPTLFFGTRYDSVVGLPWYNTVVWTCITVPVGTLALATVGIVSSVRRWQADGDGVVLMLNWLVLLVVRALPGTPVHDAERLILPSFAFLAALAGVGCDRVWVWAGRAGIATRPAKLFVVPRRFGKPMALAALVAVYVGSATSLVWYAPQWLSYYNLASGGLRGADALGMEATYYWDALDGEVLDWLHAHTSAEEKIEFAAASPLNLELLERWGVLRRGWRSVDPGAYRWRVIQRRPTFWTAADRRLIENAAPAYTKTIRPPSMGCGPWRLDVPLIYVFSRESR